jgi:hypothetical protein
MTPTKRDTLVLQVGGLAWGYQPHTVKNLLLRKANKGKKLDGFNDDGESWSQEKWKDIVRQAKAHSWL